MNQLVPLRLSGASIFASPPGAYNIYGHVKGAKYLGRSIAVGKRLKDVFKITVFCKKILLFSNILYCNAIFCGGWLNYLNIELQINHLEFIMYIFIFPKS